MKPFIHTYFRISAICVMLTLLLQSWVLKLLFQVGFQSLMPNILVVLFSGTGAYFVFYKVSVWVYEKWAWRRMFKDLCIDGTWYHSIESQAKPDYRRFGRTQVRHELLSIQLTGMNYDRTFDRTTRSLWRSTAVSMNEEGMLVFTYQTTRAGAADPQEKTGLMYVQLYGERGKPPERMEGIFQDASPSDLRGSITWERSTAWSSQLPCHGSDQDPTDK